MNPLRPTLPKPFRSPRSLRSCWSPRPIAALIALALGQSVAPSPALWAQPTPAPPQTGATLLVGAKAHLGTGDAIENAAIGFRNGTIDFVGRANEVDRSKYTEVVDVTGSHVYPGFIAPNTTLGLQEIEAVRASVDAYEVGTFRPNVRSVIAYNTESEVIPTVRTNGVLLGQPTPRGGVISGSSGVVHFDAWNWEDAAIRMVDGVHLHWPVVLHRHYDAGSLEVRRAKSYDQQRREIESFFREAAAYLQAHPRPVAEASATPRDIRLEAMRGVFRGGAALYVHADDARALSEVVHFKRAFNLAQVVIVGGAESHRVADMLRDNGISVMLQRVHSLPYHEDDDVDLPFKLPKLLQDEGVLFCLQNEGPHEFMGTRNLPFYAGTACAYGLTYEQAVRSVSLNAARILGIDARYGSLEAGKSATLFISTGDALDMRTNHVTHAFIDGRSIDLNNRQRELYRKYQAKYNAPIQD